MIPVLITPINLAIPNIITEEIPTLMIPIPDSLVMATDFMNTVL